MSNRTEPAPQSQSKTEPNTNSVTLKLSSNGFGNILWSNHANDFEFEVCNDHYFCPSFIAEFLSPHISNIRRSDCTIRKMVISAADSSNYFQTFLSFGFGFTVCFKFEDYSIFQSLCLELENTELYEQLSNFLDESLTEENVISRLKTFDSVDSSCERAIEFVASHLMDIDISSIFELNNSILSRIFGRSSLRLQSEDWCYETILEHISKSSIESFFDVISESFYILTPSIWENLRSRFVSGSSSSLSPRLLEQHFLFQEDSPFDGLISFLTQHHHGNVHDLDIISVTSSRVNSNRHAKHVELSSNECTEFMDLF
jgi:hypothetical protein